MQKVVYLASPYSHPDEWVRSNRYQDVSETAARIIVESKGEIMPFAPITHSHPLFVLRPETGADFRSWQAFDEWMIRACDELWVLTLSGWEQSVGVNAEIAFAHGIRRKVYYLTYGSHQLKDQP